MTNGQGYGLILCGVGLIFSWPWLLIIGAILIILGTALDKRP